MPLRLTVILAETKIINTFLICVDLKFHCAAAEVKPSATRWQDTEGSQPVCCCCS